MHDVTFRLQVGRDIEGSIGDEQWSRIGRHIHHKDMAHAAARLQTATRSDHCVHQLIGVQAPFHHRVHFARTGHRNRFLGSCMTMFRLHHSER